MYRALYEIKTARVRDYLCNFYKCAIDKFLNLTMKLFATRMSSFLIVGLLLLSACSKNASTKEANVAIAKKLFENFNRHDWKGMASLYADSASYRDPSFGDTLIVQTQADIVAKYSAMEAMIPDLKDEIVQIYAAEDGVVIVEFASTGTSPDGNKFRLPICSILHFSNGKIVKDLTYYDNF